MRRLNIWQHEANYLSLLAKYFAEENFKITKSQGHNLCDETFSFIFASDIQNKI
jgi:hypothetical protein